MRRVLFATAALCVTMASAHLTPGSLKLSIPGPYHPGDTLTVSFGVDIPHGGVNIDLTLNGKTWTTIKSNLSAPSKKTYTYKWTVGKDTTSHGKLRICQMNPSTCTDADSTNDPSGAIKGSRYVLISDPFIIAPVSALSPRASDANPFLRIIGPGSLDLDFSLASEGRVTLAAYDARGREAAVLLRENFPAGSHRLSLFSEALRAHPDWVLRLDAAGQVRALHP